jgi:hypothetical protein
MEPVTLPLEEFWKWLAGHYNCILRAGTYDAVLYDDEDLHWHLAGEGGETRVVQLVFGKRLLGELLIEPDRVTYVEGVPGDGEEEYIFELIWEDARDRVSTCFFVLTHGFEDDDRGFSPIH